MLRSPNLYSKLERAQILPIVVIGVIVMIAFAALIIDGGSVMLNRRTAQAAADAGALAGAKRLCLGKSDAQAVAEDYALNKNDATTATVTVNGKIVTVVAEVDRPSYFAKIFGQDSDAASAKAIAGCFAIEGNYMMPIAWSCRPPVGGGPFDPELGCKIMALDWEEIVKPLLDGAVKPIPGNTGNFHRTGDNIVNVVTGEPPSQIYIVMDKISTNQDTLCKEDLLPTNLLYSTAIICDLNGDGKNDIEGAGNRGWLDLNNGGGGAVDMRNWIIYGLNFKLSPHTWLAGQTGTVPNVYEALKTYRQGKDVKIPVFNAICDNTDPTHNVNCMAAAGHPNPWPVGIDYDPSGGNKPKFHIVTFDPFYISCVHTKKSDYCPGFALAQQMNPNKIPDNITSVEGFFLTNIDGALDLEQECTINLGNCQASLK